MSGLKNKKGQNTAEYAILIGLVVAAVIAMQTYVKRGVQGRMHDASNKFYDGIKNADWSEISSTPPDPLAKNQYEPKGLSRQSTQETVKDENYERTLMSIDTEGKKVEPGIVTRESKTTTKHATGDYQKYEYGKD